MAPSLGAIFKREAPAEEPSKEPIIPVEPQTTVPEPITEKPDKYETHIFNHKQHPNPEKPPELGN